MDYRTALITGASSGLGRALSIWFSRQGVKVWAAARRTERLEALRSEAGANIMPVKLDVSDPHGAHARVTELDREAGGFDLVIANAGVGGDTSGRHLDWSAVQAMVDVNVSGALATLCAPLPGMVERKRGHLVGISSIAGLVALPKHSTYCASKAFLSMWLEALRLDVSKVGLHVTCIYPGFVKSEMTAKNQRRMPFLLETDDAVERMGRAIVRKEERLAFPWQFRALATAATTVLPRPLVNLLVRQLR